jgi:quercetin dioxygenase-like cupin family protein
MSYLRILGMAVVLAGGAQLIQPAYAEPPQPVVVPILQKDLPDLPGKEMLMLTVEYPPGTVEQIHRHDAYTFLYVL